MERSRTDLAHAIDALANAGRATVTESKTELALYQLGATDARDIVALLEPAGFRLTRLADEGGDIPPSAIDDASVGIELVAAKPAVPDVVFPVLTTVGFARVLDRAPAEAVLWVPGLQAAVETITAAYLPWGTESAFTPGEEPSDPARVVRFLGDGEPPGRIGRWLLRDPDVDVSGPILTQWRRRACLMLCRALAQEVERDGLLLFRGPPPTRFRAEGDRHLDVASLAALQRAAEWVFQNPRELENRHGLLAAEVARTALRDGDLTDCQPAPDIDPGLASNIGSDAVLMNFPRGLTVYGRVQTKVALEAIRGDLTLAELAAKHGIHPTMIATWKRQAIDAWRRPSRARPRRPRSQATTRPRSCPCRLAVRRHGPTPNWRLKLTPCPREGHARFPREHDPGVRGVEELGYRGGYDAVRRYAANWHR